MPPAKYIIASPTPIAKGYPKPNETPIIRATAIGKYIKTNFLNVTLLENKSRISEKIDFFFIPKSIASRLASSIIVSLLEATEGVFCG